MRSSFNSINIAGKAAFNIPGPDEKQGDKPGNKDLAPKVPGVHVGGMTWQESTSIVANHSLDVCPIFITVNSPSCLSRHTLTHSMHLYILASLLHSLPL